MFDRKEYDRKRAARIYEDFKVRRVAVMKVLGDKCCICEAKAVKGFHLHHKYYHETESAYKRTSKSMVFRLKRLSEAENNPERFALLCPTCHILIHTLKERKVDKETLIRNIEALL